MKFWTCFKVLNQFRKVFKFTNTNDFQKNQFTFAINN